MVYNATSHMLTCISRGSPATTVIWRRNGVVINDDGGLPHEKTQRINLAGRDYDRLQYQNQLIGDFSIAGITCQVSNTIASSQVYPIIGMTPVLLIILLL